MEHTRIVENGIARGKGRADVGSLGQELFELFTRWWSQERWSVE